LGEEESVVKTNFVGACAAAIVAGAISLGATGALANTYNLDIDHCTGNCNNGTQPFGTVQVTQNGANLDFLVTLNGSYVFQKSTGLDAFNFGFSNNPGTPASVITNLSSGFTVVTTTGNHEDGFGDFQFSIDKAATGGNSLSFRVLGETLANLALSSGGSPSVLFAADIFGNGNTGMVGGSTLVPGVPEPATWGMMLLGFAGLGFAFRQTRRKVSFA
jgi:PEP-CTERM motif